MPPKWEGTMSDISKRTRRRYIREKAVVRDAANGVQQQPSSDGQVQGSETETGLPIEDQVRKEWNPRNGGLPILTQ
jgi:hypothetical protein